MSSTDIDVMTPEQTEMLEKFRTRVERDIASERLRIPPLPELAVKLHNIATSEDPDIRAATKIVERDANLAAHILQEASSLAYGSTRKVTDLQQAIIRVGVMTLRDVAYALTVGAVFRCGPLAKTMGRVNAHAFVVARGTAFACGRVGLEEQEGFLCGLLHDVGRQALLAACAKYGRTNPQLLHTQNVSLVLDHLHVSVGAKVLEMWEVEPIIQQIGAFHHTPNEASTEARSMAAAVAAADVTEHIEAGNAEERAEKLQALNVGNEAGLSPEDCAGLAGIVQQAQADPLIDLLTR